MPTTRKGDHRAGADSNHYLARSFRVGTRMFRSEDGRRLGFRCDSVRISRSGDAASLAPNLFPRQVLTRLGRKFRNGLGLNRSMVRKWWAPCKDRPSQMFLTAVGRFPEAS